VLFILP